MEPCVFLPVLLAALVLGYVCWVVYLIGARQSRARKAYHASLDALKRDPSNPDLRERTLALGREYVAALTAVGQAGPGAFTEVALMNDIQAACAGAASTPASAAPTPEQRLAQLQGMLSQGLISEQEYQSKRQQIIDEV